MKIIIILLTLLILVGCSEVNDEGFYIEGKKKGIHKITKTPFNEYGYNIKGYDKYGFDRKGYNNAGFDVNGFNKDGVHNKTNTKFNEKGYDLKGYDSNGFNKRGYDVEGFDISGFDKRGFNKKRIHKLTNMKYDREFRDFQGNKLVTDFKIGNYVDDFGDETGEKFVYISGIKGTFSNSATYKSDAFLKMRIDSSGFDFIIKEYNRTNRANIGKGPWLYVYTDKKEKFSFDLLGDRSQWATQGTVTLYNSKRVNYSSEKLRRILANCKNVRIHIEGDYRTEYDFEIDTEGLEVVMKSISLKFKRY